MNRDQHANKLSVLATDLIRGAAHAASTFQKITRPDDFIPGVFDVKDSAHLEYLHATIDIKTVSAYEFASSPVQVIPGGRSYSGHGEHTGGLQAHSIGGTYPFVIGACQTTLHGPVYWYVLDSRDGKKSCRFLTQAQAIYVARAVNEDETLYDLYFYEWSA